VDEESHGPIYALLRGEHLDLAPSQQSQLQTSAGEVKEQTFHVRTHDMEKKCCVGPPAAVMRAMTPKLILLVCGDTTGLTEEQTPVLSAEPVCRCCCWETPPW